MKDSGTLSKLNRWWHSVQTKSTLAILITAGVLIETTAAVQYWFAREGIRKEVQHRAESELRVKTLEIEKVMTAVEAACNATVWTIEECIAKGSPVDSTLCHILAHNPNIIGCGLGFTANYYPWKGQWYELYAERQGKGYGIRQIGSQSHDYLNADWFVKPFTSGEDYWTEPYFDEAGGHAMLITYALPVHDKAGNIVAVFGADISLEWLSSVLNAHHIYPSSYNVMVSRQGKLMACPVESLVMQKSLQEVTARYSDTTVAHVNQQMMAGNTGQATIIDEHGDKKYIFYAPIHRDSLSDDDGDLGWSMAVVCNDSEIYHNLRVVGFNLLILLFIGLALLAFIMFRSIHGLMRLQAVNSQKERIENELNIARKIQLAMLPKIFPPYPERTDIDIYASLDPAREVGGDFYDFLIRDEKLFFCIGDVSGKGVPAALVMAVMRTLFRNVTMHEAQPNRIITTINDTVAADNESNMFVTMFVGVLDLPTGQLKYCNAGHDAPLLVATTTGILPCDANLPVGVMEHWKYTQQEASIDPDTIIFLYTDGLTEAENADHAQFGMERIMDVTRTADKPKAVIDIMTEAVKRFVGDAEQSDDLTQLAIQYSKQQHNIKLQRSLTLTNDTQQITLLSDFISDIGEKLHCSGTDTLQINLAVEEAVANVINYAYPAETKGYVNIVAQADDEQLVFTISDSGEPFDPTAREEVDITLPAEERPIGGLGIHLVRNIMDYINYNRIDGKNVLTLSKKLK